MAQIVPTKEAPNDAVVYQLPAAEFALGQGDSFETEDRAVLSDASAHPWLEVKYPKSEAAVPTFRPDSVAREDDVLAAQNSEAFDTEAIRRDAAVEASVAPLAVEPTLDQNKKVTEGGFARTLAADAANTEKSKD